MPSQENKYIARYVASAFGSRPRVGRYWDGDDKSHIDIAASVDSPTKGITSFSTIGLSDTPLLLDGREYDVRAEFVGACGSGFSQFGDALATAAFCVINSDWFCYPGATFPDVLSMSD